MSDDPYETLGVAKDATKDQIKKAYRKKMKDAHPDREDGDHATAVALNKAWDTLGDDEKRKRFDETGSAGPQEPTIEDKARMSLAKAFDELLGDEIEWAAHEDPLARLKKGIKEALVQYEVEIKMLDSYIEKLNRKVKRVKLKAGTPESMDLWEHMAKEREGRYTKKKAALAEIIEITKLAQQMLADYEAEIAEKPPASTSRADYFATAFNDYEDTARDILRRT